MEPRITALHHWLDSLGYRDYSLETASADASFRRYFRLQTAQGETFIVMDAPPTHEDTGPFIRISALLDEIGIHVPRVLEQEPHQGFLLLTDLGDQMLLPNLNKNNADTFYSNVMQSLLKFQKAAPPEFLPAYDERLLMNEMQLFPDWFVVKLMQRVLTATEQSVVEQCFNFLRDTALSQPKVIVHRDYHSRNIMLSQQQGESWTPGILDFQDAVFGPVTYDLVSLLKDCYVRWPREQVTNWVKDYLQLCKDEKLIEHGVSSDAFIRWFDLMGLQRHIKVLGIFSRLFYRDGKAGYLKDIPLTLDYVLEAGHLYDEMQEFITMLEDWGLPQALPATQAILNTGK